jgi:hypothetical protein
MLGEPAPELEVVIAAGALGNVAIHLLDSAL